MGFLKNLKGYAKDAATAKVDEAKARARDAVASTSVGSAAIGFVDKVNSSQAPDYEPMDKTWLSVGGDRWSGPDEDRMDFYGAKVVAVPDGDSANVQVYTDGGKLLCTLTPKMKSYQDAMGRAGTVVSHLIAERKTGDYGTYWRVGLYYWDSEE